MSEISHQFALLVRTSCIICCFDDKTPGWLPFTDVQWSSALRGHAVSLALGVGGNRRLPAATPEVAIVSDASAIWELLCISKVRVTAVDEKRFNSSPHIEIPPVHSCPDDQCTIRYTHSIQEPLEFRRPAALSMLEVRGQRQP